MTTNQQLLQRSADGVTGRPLGLAAYRAASAVLGLLAPLLLQWRAARGKEERARMNERFGAATRARPPGTLIWIHGASVGECLAALPLVSRLIEKPQRNVLLTSGTVTSARLMAERLPARAFHQYAPVDSRGSVKRFLDHWRPDAALFIESELWPNFVLETHARAIPLALVNARLSERSFHGWMRAPATARALLSAFDICLAQDAAVARRLAGLGAAKVRMTGSLKADAPPLPYDETALAAFRAAAGKRPIFLAASTHPGEEESLFDAISLLRKQHPDLLAVIVPRHPERGADIEARARARGFGTIRRASGTLPTPGTAIYIADTLGELGLFYRAAPFAFLGGSLVEHGGQNPLEPAQLGTAILTGPHTGNFAESFGVLLGAQKEGRVNSAEELAALAARLLADPAQAKRRGEAAKAAAATLGGALPRTLAAVEQLLASHARA